jgi:hypothetical protein
MLKRTATTGPSAALIGIADGQAGEHPPAPSMIGPQDQMVRSFHRAPLIAEYERSFGRYAGGRQ